MIVDALYKLELSRISHPLRVEEVGEGEGWMEKKRILTLELVGLMDLMIQQLFGGQTLYELSNYTSEDIDRHVDAVYNNVNRKVAGGELRKEDAIELLDYLADLYLSLSRILLFVSTVYEESSGIDALLLLKASANLYNMSVEIRERMGELAEE